MQSALKVMTRVLHGNRVEFSSPELIEGEDVELIVLRSENSTVKAAPRQFENVIAYIDSLTPIERTPEEWADVDREFFEERNSWGD